MISYLIKFKILVVLSVLFYGAAKAQETDPTRPIIVEKNDDSSVITIPTVSDGFPTLKVTSVVVTPEQRYAIVNGEAWQERETKQQVLLSAVSVDDVTFRYQQKTKVITLKNALVISEVNDEF